MSYLSKTTRLDIAFAVGYLAQEQVNPQPIHYKLISHLLSYLATNRRMGLLCRKNSDANSKIELYADADFATDKSRVSTTGYLVRYHGSVIHWVSRLQSGIAESSTEAELKSLTEAAHEALYIVRLQQELLSVSELPIVAYEDNEATYEKYIAVTRKNKLKHIEMMYFKVVEYVREGLFDLRLVGTQEQLADGLTKALPERLFVPMFTQLMYNDNDQEQ